MPSEEKRAYSREPQAPRTGSRRRGPRKSNARRRGKRRSGCLTALVYFAFIVGISIILAGVGWRAANDLLALDKEEKTVVFTVDRDDDLDDIIDRLQEEGIIEYKILFSFYARVSDAKEKITTGTYELSTTMDYRAIVTAMSARSAARLTVKVIIPEGYTVGQTLKLMADKGVNTLEELEEYAANYDYGFSFLQDIPLGDVNRLEGYLFPDTYEFLMGESAKTAINKLLVNFDARVTDDMRNQAAAKGYTLHEIITIASLIEKETTGEDQRTIASVIYNRLNNDNFPYLQIDASVQYALPERKGSLTHADLEIDSPYNTYKYEGLPPGPIANPGMAAIYATLNPESTRFYFYVLGDDNDHHFFQTRQGFEDFIQTLQRNREG